MRTIQKILSAVTASAMALSMAAGSMTANLSGVSAADKSAVQIVDDMGMGWNLGNTFDCWNCKSWASQTETGWGNPVTSKAMIDAVKATGFDSVRIPVTWYENTDASTFDIDDAYLARVKTVVDYCIDNDMYAIINMHWDWVSDGSLWLNKGEAALPQFTTMWTEIANYFKDYDEHLVFEDMNEVTFDYGVLNKFNQSFVDTVRKTGGNNADRLLLLAGKNTNLDDTCSSNFVVPNDDMVAVSIHYYLPPKFTVGTKSGGWGYSDTWGSDADINELVNYFNKMKTTFADKGVPVILGEYGVVTNDGKDAASIQKFLKTVASQALSTSGISAFLWDSGQGGDMQYFDRAKLAWRNEEIGKIFADLGNGNIDNLATGWVETTFEAVTDDDGNVVPGAYRIDIGNASQFKLEIEAEHRSTGGTGGISYWDNNANGGKGTWVNNALGVNFGYNEQGESNVSQTAEDANGDTVIVNDNFFEIPADVSTNSVQFQMFYVGYSDAAGNWVDSDVAYPTLVKAYIPGAVDPDATEPTQATDAPEVTEPTNATDATEATEPTEVTDATDTTEATEPVSETQAPDPETDGYTFALHGQFAGNDFWKDDAPTVNVKESGSYTLTWEAAGETKTGDLAMFIDSNVDIYHFALNEDSTGILDGTLNITVDSILIDGNEVELGEMKLMANDDGKSLRLAIVNPWASPEIAGFDANVTIEEKLEVNFTVQLGLDENGEIIYGDVNGDGDVDILDVILVNKFLLGSASLDDRARAAADVDLDGEVGTTDSLNILKKVVEMVETLPIQ